MASCTKRADEQSEVGKEDEGKYQRGQKLEVCAASFHNLYSEHGCDKAARKKPSHELALVRRKVSPCKAPPLHGKPAGDQKRRETFQCKNRVLPQTAEFQQCAQ